MKALVIERAGKRVAENVSVRTDWPDPGDPPPGHVLVRTHASALNHLDLWVGMGVPGLELTYPRVSGSDACGVVEAVGKGVDESWVGKKVIVNAAIPQPERAAPGAPPLPAWAPDYQLIGEHHNGMLAERFHAPAAAIADVGDDADPIKAAAYGLTFLTAYSMLVTKAGLRPGQRVLITGIGGGVALAALALARHWSCPVAVTSRHQWKLDRATELGADFAVLDEGQDWFREVRKWSGGRGVDAAVDSTGKATHLKCIKALARGGAYVTPGCTSGPDATTDLARIFWNQLRILGSTMGTREEFSQVVALFRSGELEPVVDTAFPAARGRDAFERLENGEQFGKLVVTW